MQATSKFFKKYHVCWKKKDASFYFIFLSKYFRSSLFFSRWQVTCTAHACINLFSSSYKGLHFYAQNINSPVGFSYDSFHIVVRIWSNIKTIIPLLAFFSYCLHQRGFFFCLETNGHPGINVFSLRISTFTRI